MAYEAEVARQRREKAVETDRIRALQERALDVRADQDALRAKRGQASTSSISINYYYYYYLL